MKACYLVGSQKFEVRETPTPSPGAGEVAVAIRCVGVCGSDRHYLDGSRDYDFAAEPFIIGHEAAGEIIEVGEGVTSLKVADRVAIDPAIPCRECETCLTGNGNACLDVDFLGLPPRNGVLQEVICRDARYVMADKQRILSYADLMMLEPLAIAVYATDVVEFRAGWTAAVVGCGAIGLSLIAVLRAMGATTIIATDVLDHKRDWALRYGADHFINPSQANAEQAVAELTDGRGVDVAFEAAGAVDAQDQAASFLRSCGTLGLIGINVEETIRLNAEVVRRKALRALYVRRSNETLERAMRLAITRDLRMSEMITHKYSLDEAPRAFEEFMNYANGVVKAGVVMEQI